MKVHYSIADVKYVYDYIVNDSVCVPVDFCQVQPYMQLSHHVLSHNHFDGSAEYWGYLFVEVNTKYVLVHGNNDTLL